MLFTLKVSNIMTEFIIKKLPYDLSSYAGMAFVGKYLKRINLYASACRTYHPIATFNPSPMRWVGW